MSGMGSDDPVETEPIDLDRLSIDSEYRRAIKLRLRREAQSGPEAEQQLASRPAED